jgi:hypothetical protein
MKACDHPRQLFDHNISGLYRFVSLSEKLVNMFLLHGRPKNQPTPASSLDFMPNSFSRMICASLWMVRTKLFSPSVYVCSVTERTRGKCGTNQIPILVSLLDGLGVTVTNQFFLFVLGPGYIGLKGRHRIRVLNSAFGGTGQGLEGSLRCRNLLPELPILNGEIIHLFPVLFDEDSCFLIATSAKLTEFFSRSKLFVKLRLLACNLEHLSLRALTCSCRALRSF